MKTKHFTIDHSFKLKALHWANTFDHVAFLNYNGLPYHYGAFPCLLAIGAERKITEEPDAFEAVQRFHQSHPSTLIGYWGYDLKNQIENLKSENPDLIDFPEYYFFQPSILMHFTDERVEITSQENPDTIYQQVLQHIPANDTILPSFSLQQRVSREKYLKTVNAIKKHLEEGDIYELNYCIDFFSNDADIHPLHTFLRLNEFSTMPFSVFLKITDRYLLSASPERFLKKEKNRLLSQPIKGTAKRGKTASEDDLLKKELAQSEKERAENMMIVDLVRNDLAKSSRSGSIKVEELFSVYTFPNVHQMISTISAEVRQDLPFTEAIKNAFPMGSMTGAPKLKAMELIENYESSKRGIFSGAVGMIAPNGDFDFNVVIRSIVYSQEKKYLSFHVGSAITYDSDPEKEYEECLLKAEAMLKALGK